MPPKPHLPLVWGLWAGNNIAPKISRDKISKLERLKAKNEEGDEEVRY